MGEIKSAWEIAQEKAKKLGRLSAEETKRQKEERAGSIAKFLAQKYLVNPNWQELETVNNYEGEEKELIKRAIFVQLVEAIELGKEARLHDISKGISALMEGEFTGSLEGIKELFREYNQMEQTVRQEINQAGRGILHRLRISGTAIGGINPQAKEEWWKTLESFAQPFEERLNSLKQESLAQLNLS